MKPDDIPVIVWSKAFNIVSDMELSFELNHEDHLVISHAIARSILQSSSQAYAECAEMADGIMDTFDGQAMRASDESDIIEARGAEYGAKIVAIALRSKANQ